MLTIALLAGVMPTAEAASPTMEFGMDAYSMKGQTNAGVTPDYATLWVGPWVLKSGWGGVDNKLAVMKERGITPTIHLYYWGDDISEDCLQNGCWSSLHGIHKNQDGWNKLTNQLNNHLWAQMGGAPVVVIVESEFNKGGLQYYEPLDRMLAEKTKQVESGYPKAITVMGLGNWNRAAWSTWDRAAAASDMVGIQGMRGSTRDSQSQYLNLYEATLAGAKHAKATFGKPVMITDIALSSYGGYESKQASELREFFTGMDALKAAGVKVIIYRSWKDSNMDTANYYGEAERHWGVLRADKSWKPAASVWVNGVKDERGATTSTTSTSGFDAKFTPSDTSNNWWVQVKVTSDKKIAKVEAIVDGKATTLDKQSWGGYAKGFYVKDGAQVKFRATSGAGATDTSTVYAWGSGGSTTTSTTSTTSTFDATFSVKDTSNNWWIATGVKSDKKIAKVEAIVDGKATTLDKQSWGDYAKSFHVKDGAQVKFRATSGAGAVTTSQVYTWGSGVSATTSTTSTFDATFSVKDTSNNWWVETNVKSDKKIAKVEAIVDGKATTLDKQSWGGHAKSFHVKDGAQVKFRATSGAGDTATSKTYTWS